ncbi:hypothetical protein QVD17_29548 [Tagetes erecta]|uniref:DUF4283 domain-containing protein n=1 Tax=Tagetes erecta TaxID=13708 RepID=A0AAD8K085_TARER|nr:hypothetical protein QVD17_29548 [Tagetes erecta]
MSESSNFIGDFSKFHLDPGDPPPKSSSGVSLQPPMVDSSILMDSNHLNPAPVTSSVLLSSFPSASFPSSDSPSTGNIERSSRVFINVRKNGPAESKLKNYLPSFKDSPQIEAAMNAFVSGTCVDPKFIDEAKAYISLHILNPEFEAKYGKLLMNRCFSKGEARKGDVNCLEMEINVNSKGVKRAGVEEFVSPTGINCGEDGMEMVDVSREGGKKVKPSELINDDQGVRFGISQQEYNVLKQIYDKLAVYGVNQTELKYVKQCAVSGKEFVEQNGSLPLLFPNFMIGKALGKDSVSAGYVVEKIKEGKFTSFKEVKCEVNKVKKQQIASSSNVLKEGAKWSVKGRVDLHSVPVVENMKFMGNKGGKVAGKGTYVSAVKGKAKVTLEDPIEYCPPVILENGEKVAMIQAKFLEKAEVVYKSMLYGYFVGTEVDLKFVRFNLYKMWRRFGIIDISSNGMGIFYFKFRNEEGMKAVMEAGPWVVANVPLCIQKYEMGMNVAKEEPKDIPIWVTFKNLPLELWNTVCICKIASCIGKPLTFDTITTNKCAKLNGIGGFARVLIQVSAENALPDCVKAVYPVQGIGQGGSLLVEVEYQQHPDRCNHCIVFGHSYENCKIRPVSEAEKVEKEKLKTEMNSVNEEIKKGKGVIDSDGFEYVGQKIRGGKQQGLHFNNGQHQVKGNYGNGRNGNMGRNGSKGQQWRMVGESSKQNNSKHEGLKHQPKKGNGEMSSSRGGIDGGDKVGNGSPGNDKGNLKIENRFDIFSSVENVDAEGEIVKDHGFVGNVDGKPVGNVHNHSKVKPQVPNRSILTRQAAAGVRLKFVQLPDDGLGKEKVHHGFSKADLYKYAMIFNKHNPKLPKEQEEEIIDMVLREEIPPFEVFGSWSKFQTRFYRQMCDTINFVKGFNAISEMLEKLEGDVEVESDEDVSAQAMKVDGGGISDGDVIMQSTNASGAAVSLKTV